MSGPLYRFLADDHRRLEALLANATARPGVIDPVPYAEFRAGLLKHIGMEEKILLPAAQRWRGGEPLPVAATLRRDHGAIAALMVPSPTPQIIATLRVIFEQHNIIEEGPSGLYEVCEQLAGGELDAIVERLRKAPDVPVAKHVDGPQIMDATRRALARGGYELVDASG